jgi:hypothetical protein
MGKGNFLPGQYESVYSFSLSDLSKKYFGDDDLENYNENFLNIIDDLKQAIQNNTTLDTYFSTSIKDTHLSKKYYDFYILAESDFYKIVVNDDDDFTIALVIDDDCYNYNLSESDINAKLAETYKDIDNALRKMLLSFDINLYKPCGLWLSGKVSDNG